MTGPRFYIDPPLREGTDVELPERAARHAKVLRLAPGDPLVLFDGSGSEYPSVVSEARRHQFRVKVGDAVSGIAEPRLRLHLGIAVLKRDAMHAALQRATELGVAAITPLYTEYTDTPRGGAERRVANWTAVLASSAEQCGRATLPTLHEVQALSAALSTPAELRVMAHPTAADPAGALGGTAPQAAPTDVFALVGPEGGFSTVEVAAASAAGFKLVSLGPRILRAETVPAVLSALLQAAWGDLNS